MYYLATNLYVVDVQTITYIIHSKRERAYFKGKFKNITYR